MTRTAAPHHQAPSTADEAPLERVPNHSDDANDGPFHPAEDPPAPAAAPEDEASSATVDARSSLARRIWALPLAAHVVALVVVLAALLPLANVTVSTPDEGAYGIQAELVADGRWDYVPALERFDPDGSAFPIAFSTPAGDRWFPYVRHPAMPWVTAQFVNVLGLSAGVLALSLLGLLLAATSAWLLAAEIDPRRSRAAFWLVASSPLLFAAYVTGAHTLAAGCAGLAMVGALRILRAGPAPGSLALLSVGLATGALFRSESVLLAGAILTCLGLARWRRAGFIAGVLAIVVPAFVMAGTLVAENRLVAAIIGGDAPRDLTMRTKTGAPSYAVGRVQGFWHSTVAGTGGEPTLAGLVLPVALLLVVVLVLTRRRLAGAGPELAVGGLVAVTLLSWAASSAGLVQGLLPAAPLLVLGVLAAAGGFGWRRDGFLLAPAALFALLVYATQYPDGGAFQWGGRFLGAVLPLLAVVAAAGLQRLVQDRPADRRRPMAAALAVLAVATSFVAVSALGSYRSGADALYAQVAAEASPVNVTTSEQLPRLMWRQHLDWLVVDEAGLAPMVRRIWSADTEQLTLVVPTNTPDVVFADWSDVDDRGALPGTGQKIVVLRR